MKIIAPPIRSKPIKAYIFPLICAIFIPSGSGPLSSLLFFKLGAPVVLEALKIEPNIAWFAVIFSNNDFESNTIAPFVAFRIENERPPIMCNSS